MRRVLWLAVGCVALAGLAFPAEPKEVEVQGLYEGSWKDGKGEGKIEARVVALGKKTFKVFVRDGIGEKSTAKLEMDGATAAGGVRFAGTARDVLWEGQYADGAISGKFGEGGTFDLKRIERKSPTLGAKPPEGAIVLLDGKDFSEMVRGGGAEWYLGDKSKDGWVVWEVPLRVVAKEPEQWPTPENPLPKGWELGKERRRADVVLVIGEDGSIQVPKGGMNSKREFEGSLKFHVEFLIPFMPEARSQGRGNSGVYLPNGEEIQVLDSFGDTTYKGGGCGGLYNYRDPDAFDKFSLASLPPLEWQTYDIEYRVQRKDGKVVGKPLVTVVHNGITIHDHVEPRTDARKGRFHFQDHGNAVRYRNIWVLPSEEK